MTEEDKAYYEAKVLSSMGLFKGDPVTYADWKVKNTPKPEEDKGFKEVENHMVVGEYYDNKED